MKKRWIPFILACIAAAAILGMRFGAQLEADRQADAQNAQRHLNTTIAVVNGDAGAMVNGGWYNYSAAIINTLGDDFVLVSPAMAQTGFASGAYAAVVTFPSNVSARILSFNAMGPERVELEFQINPNLSEQEYLETFIAITELQLAINTTLASTYVSSILRQFHYAQDHVDGIFQNNLADLFALDIITLGNFTANLELDDVPFVPIQPRELDTPFYMTQVRAFAEEVAGWYLHSYAMASNQFLWMRDGLIRLTDNFPAQEDQWVHMMMAWTRYSEFYGELLDIFFEDVSRHEDELRDWHLETLAWHDALELYQSQVLGWHDISNLWLWDAEDWYMDYTGFLRALQEYAAALDRHHILLDNSLDPVMDDLEAWRGILREYELGMYLQYMAMQAWIEAHDGQANITNTFLRDLRDWYRELRKHHSAMALWYERLNRMHDNLYNVHSDLDGASEIFSGGLERLRAVSVELPPGGFPDVPTLGIVPIPATGAALVVTAPTVILIGIMLAPFAITQSSENMLLAVITLAIVVIASSWGKGMIKIIPILLGIGGAYIVALIMNGVGMTNADGSAILDFAAAAEARIVGMPPFMAPRFSLVAILVMVPFALATIAEHVGDMVALSSITGEDFIEDPGLTRTLIGDGVASCFSGLIGGPASTTYGENVGVVALTKIFNPRVVQVAAIYAAVLGFSPLFATVIYSVPNAIIGGASFMLYGMIAAVGVRNLVESRVDMSKTKNLTVVAIMLVTGLGLRFGPTITFSIGATNIPVDRLGIAIAVVLGVVLNAILPDGPKEEAVK